MNKKFAALMALTRYKEHIVFVLPLSILGAILGSIVSTSNLGFQSILMAIANLLAISFAFMINDIEDAPDDARNPIRKQKNPISNGTLTKSEGYLACTVVVLAAIYLYSQTPQFAFISGLLTLILSFAYSSRLIRLKAWPVTDITSHGLMLSGLLLLSSYFVYTPNMNPILPLFAATTLVSIYGQLYNQLRDYKEDKAAKLKNTTILLGKDATFLLMYIFLFIAAICFGLSAYGGIFPIWLLAPMLVGWGIGLKFKTGSDPRGTKAIDITGDLQNTFWIAINITLLTWLIWILIK
jgi:4-hydroxybenzoate polyprenyltransferase